MAQQEDLNNAPFNPASGAAALFRNAAEMPAPQLATPEVPNLFPDFTSGTIPNLPKLQFTPDNVYGIDRAKDSAMKEMFQQPGMEPTTAEETIALADRYLTVRELMSASFKQMGGAGTEQEAGEYIRSQINQALGAEPTVTDRSQEMMAVIEKAFSPEPLPEKMRLEDIDKGLLGLAGGQLIGALLGGGGLDSALTTLADAYTQSQALFNNKQAVNAFNREQERNKAKAIGTWLQSLSDDEQKRFAAYLNAKLNLASNMTSLMVNNQQEREAMLSNLAWNMVSQQFNSEQIGKQASSQLSARLGELFRQSGLTDPTTWMNTEPTAIWYGATNALSILSGFADAASQVPGPQGKMLSSLIKGYYDTTYKAILFASNMEDNLGSLKVDAQRLQNDIASITKQMGEVNLKYAEPLKRLQVSAAEQDQINSRLDADLKRQQLGVMAQNLLEAKTKFMQELERLPYDRRMWAAAAVSAEAKAKVDQFAAEHQDTAYALQLLNQIWDIKTQMNQAANQASAATLNYGGFANPALQDKAVKQYNEEMQKASSGMLQMFDQLPLSPEERERYKAIWQSVDPSNATTAPPPISGPVDRNKR